MVASHAWRGRGLGSPEFLGSRVSTGKDKKVLEIDSGDGCTTLRVYTYPTVYLQMAQMLNFLTGHSPWMEGQGEIPLSEQSPVLYPRCPSLIQVRPSLIGKALVQQIPATHSQHCCRRWECGSNPEVIRQRRPRPQRLTF